MMRIDARLPLRFGPLESWSPGEAVLFDEDRFDGDRGGAEPAAWFTPDAPEHVAGCVCCGARSGAARALSELFRRRAVAAGPAFRGVLAVVGPEGEAAVRAALVEDGVIAARYRLMRD